MPASKRVVWDENNLRANAEYQKAHPVTMHITEPKTPYVYLDDDSGDGLHADAEGTTTAARRDGGTTFASTSPPLPHDGDAKWGSTKAGESGDDGGGGDDDDNNTTWDPSTKAFVRQLKQHIAADQSDALRAPVSSSGRPMLAPGTASGVLAQKRHASEFAKMRKAVYADEGAKFRALLAQQRQKQCDDDDDDDDNEGNEEDKGEDEESAGGARSNGSESKKAAE